MSLVQGDDTPVERGKAELRPAPGEEWASGPKTNVQRIVADSASLGGCRDAPVSQRKATSQVSWRLIGIPRN